MSGNSLNTLWAYEPDTDTWDTRPPMPAVRDGASVGVGDGRLLVVGGFDAVDGDLFAYSQATGAWTREPGPEVRLDAAVAEAAGIVYQTGGRGWNGSVLEIAPAPQVFGRSPGTGQWSEVAEQPRVRNDPATAVLGGLIHFVGGRELSQVQGTHMGWDPTPDQWYEFPDLIPERTGGVAVVLDGEFYVLGGRIRTGMSDRVDRFVRQ